MSRRILFIKKRYKFLHQIKNDTYIYKIYNKLIVVNQWYQIMNHVSLKIILHFEISIENVKIQQPKFQAFKVHKCKLCAMLKI